MGLNLNGLREAYKEFYGKNVEQMPALIADGRIPLNVAQLMKRRLDLRNGPAEVKTAWMDNYFDTIDGIVYHPEGTETLIVLDSEQLRTMNAQSPRNGGALLLDADRDKAFAVYEQLKKQPNVTIFKRGELGKVGEWMSKEDVKVHPVWKVLAREQALLKDYTDLISDEAKVRFNYDTIMGVFPSSCNGKAPEMRAFFVLRLDSWSDVSGRIDLDSDVGRLVGLAPEAPVASGNGTQSVKTYTLADLQAFDNAMQGLESVLNPNLLKPFADFRRKL